MTTLARNTALRRWVENRDGGICSLCGCDTYKARRVFAAANFYLKCFWGIQTWDLFNQLLELSGWPRLSRDWWEADHILPLAEGGNDTLDNLRTLCIPCHRRETAKLQKRLAKQNRLQAKKPRQKYTTAKLSEIWEYN